VTDITTVEVKVWKRGKAGWREHIGPTSPASCMDEVVKLVKEHEDETGSYQVSIRLNGGYSKGGVTYLMNFSGDVTHILNMVVIHGK